MRIIIIIIIPCHQDIYTTTFVYSGPQMLYCHQALLYIYTTPPEPPDNITAIKLKPVFRTSRHTVMSNPL